MNILIIRLSALGDVAMTIPAIYSVAESYPMYRFHVLTTAFCSKIFIAPPTNVILHPLEKVSLKTIFQCVKDIRIDEVADLHNVLRSWVIDIIYLLKGKRIAILDKKREERGAIKKNHHQTSVPFTVRYFQVFSRLGMPWKNVFYRLPLSSLPGLPKDFPMDKRKKWIGIAPFARYRNKTYPLDLMRRVVELLASNTEIELFLFGSKKESQVLASWGESPTQVRTIAGRYTIGQELSLIARMEIMITMDSANMHLASLVGTRVISIWGSTTPACGFLGWNQREDDTVLSHCTCQPCTIAGSDKCKYDDFHCLTSISPEKVVEKVLSSL